MTCHELHDLLMSLVILPVSMTEQERARHWMNFYERLERDGRAQTFEHEGLAMLDRDGTAPLVMALWSESAGDKLRSGGGLEEMRSRMDSDSRAGYRRHVCPTIYH